MEKQEIKKSLNEASKAIELENEQLKLVMQKLQNRLELIKAQADVKLI